MFVYTKITIDIETGTVLEREGFDYDGPVILCKGDDSAKQAEQQQTAFNASLMSLFQQQFGKQNAITDQLTKTLMPMLQNPTGFSDDALAALRSQAKESATDAYANATKAFQTQSFARGGRDLPSGVDEQIQGGISGGAAAQEAGAQQNITLANEQQKQQNFWKAIDGLNGVSAQVNPLGYAGAATSGSGAVAGLSNAVTSSQQSGVLGGILGGVFGAGSALLGNPALFGKKS
jgi:hypothetical protein